MVAQMEVFKKNRFIFTLIGLCQYDKKVKWQEKIWSVLASTLLYAVNSFSIFTSVAFAIRNMSVDLENTIYAVFQFSASKLHFSDKKVDSLILFFLFQFSLCGTS